MPRPVFFRNKGSVANQMAGRALVFVPEKRGRARHGKGGTRASTSVRIRSEGQDRVQNLLAVARLLDVGDLAAATVGDAGLGDL